MATTTKVSAGISAIFTSLLLLQNVKQSPVDVLAIRQNTLKQSKRFDCELSISDVLLPQLVLTNRKLSLENHSTSINASL